MRENSPPLLERGCITALDGANGEIGDLSLLLMPDPIDDNFTNRIVLSGYTTHCRRVECRRDDRALEKASMFSIPMALQSGSLGRLQQQRGRDHQLQRRGILSRRRSLHRLQRVGSSLVAYNTFFGTLSFTTDASATYQIVLAGAWGGSGNYTMDLILNAGAHNDNFGNRIVLTGTNLTILANNSTAANHSLWWEYIAPANGSVRVDYSAVTEFTPLFNLYTGANQSSLQSQPRWK